jgi:DNA-binding CsgD family transcriptional regulator
MLFIVLGLAVNIMRTLNESLPWENTRIVATWFNNPWAIFTEVAVYVGLGLLLFYAVTHRISELWSQVPFAVMLAGLIGLLFVRAEFMDTQGYAVYSMTMEWLLQLTYTFTMVSIMRSLPLTTFQVIGLATAISNMLSLLRVFVLGEAYTTIGLVVIGAAYLIAILVSSLRKDDPAAVIETGAASASVETPQLTLVERIHDVGLKGGLTERETEILGLLVQGMSLPSIQRELVVASDTVRTHVKHIYRKLDVHTRQELIGLFLK